MVCDGSSVILKVALPVSGLALLFHGIGYSTNSWQITKLFDTVIDESGLWNENFNTYTLYGDELRSTRAFASIAFIMLIAVTVALFISLCIDFFRKKLFIILEFLTAIAAGVLIMLAVIIYGSTIIPGSQARASWSLGLSVFGGILAFVAGALILVGGCIMPKSESK